MDLDDILKIDVLSVDSLFPMAKFIKDHLIQYIARGGYGEFCIPHYEIEAYIKHLRRKSKSTDDWENVIFKELKKINNKVAKKNKLQTDSNAEPETEEFDSFFEAIKTMDYFYRYSFVIGNNYDNLLTLVIGDIIENECTDYVRNKDSYKVSDYWIVKQESL